MRAPRIGGPPAGSWMLASSACLGLLASTDARADDDLLGLYAGAGVGYAKINQYFNAPGGPTYFPSEHRTGWKLLVGFRPLRWLGSELEYTDFGSAHVGPSSDGASPPNQLYGADGHVRATSLFAVGYLPLPPRVSWMDVFGKVGLSYTRASDSYAGNFPNAYICSPSCVPIGQISVDESVDHTGPAWGGGVQFHFGRLSARLEAEGLSWRHTKNPTLTANPVLTSFVVTWKF
jgi:opacity protein-like surface antigen